MNASQEVKAVCALVALCRVCRAEEGCEMTATAIKTRAGVRHLPFVLWNGQQLRSAREVPLGFDTETAMITDERVIPDLALATASDGRTHVLVHADRVGEFLLVHRDASLVAQNVAFDFWVVDQHLRRRGEREAGRVLWDMCERGRLFDTQILDMLVQLATAQFRGMKGAGDGEESVYPANLAALAAEYLGYELDKEDPYRTRFGELIELTTDEWARVDQGFFAYAIADAATVRQLYPAVAERAYRLLIAHGFSPTAKRYEIRPDAIDKFGYLSEVIQVQASVVLADMYRRGVRVDVAAASALEARHRQQLQDVIATLERDHRDVLTYGKDGKLLLTPKGKTPSLAETKLGPKLNAVADEIRAAGHPIQVPTADGKKKGISLSAKQWAKYASLHPFLAAWLNVSRTAKLLQFFANLQHERLHCRYTLLKRTGRTSCAGPRGELPGVNIQQMPRDAEFRSLFRPDADGEQLFTGDFAGAELRTLAANCRARFGFSKLGDVFVAGIDPHVATAAAIQGLTTNEFLALKESELALFKAGRQSAKALNFGIPGGLGSGTLIRYAEANYQVKLSEEEAGRFRTKLIEETYPELNPRDGYLADSGLRPLACAFGVTEREVWEVLAPDGRREPWLPRAAAKVVSGTSTASPRFRDGVWSALFRLTRTGRPSPELAAAVTKQAASFKLRGMLFDGTAATLTGRLRAGVGYTEAKNTPFQSLCADGGKLALWRLLYAGFKPYAFVHDEILVSLPGDTAEDGAKRVKRIMEQAMEEVMGHDIPAECDAVVAPHWKKP